MSHDKTSATAAAGPGLSEGLGAAVPKRDRLALWGNLLMAHAWGAACYVRPGWFPAAVSLVSILLAALILYEDKITAAIAARADDDHA